MLIPVCISHPADYLLYLCAQPENTRHFFFKRLLVQNFNNSRLWRISHTDESIFLDTATLWIMCPSSHNKRSNTN